MFVTGENISTCELFLKCLGDKERADVLGNKPADILRRIGSNQGREQARLTNTVGASDGEHVTNTERERNILHKLTLTLNYRKMFNGIDLIRSHDRQRTNRMGEFV